MAVQLTMAKRGKERTRESECGRRGEREERMFPRETLPGTSNESKRNKIWRADTNVAQKKEAVSLNPSILGER